MAKKIFKTDYSLYKHRNGQEITVVREITEPEEGFDAEVLPMFEIRFPDRHRIACWPDEIVESADFTD